MGGIKIVSASAGSGKTYQLAYEYIKNVIEKPYLYRNILAVTFTNKATEEMKQRIIGEINTLANTGRSSYMKKLITGLGLSEDDIRTRAAEVRTKILHDYSHFTVVTIDKFFQRIIRSFIKELGIELNFNIELQTDSLLESAADRLIDEITIDERLREWLVKFAEEKIDDNKKWDIKSELTDIGDEIFKERYKSLPENSISKKELSHIIGEAIGKCKAIADKMVGSASKALQIISENGLSIDDFPFGKSGFVGYFSKTAHGTLEKYGKRVEDALSSDEKWYSKNSSKKDIIRTLIPQLKPLLEELCKTYDSTLQMRNSTKLLKENFRSFALLDDLTAKVKNICAEQNLIPISETNTIISKLISGNDTPFIFEKVGNNFSHYMIDEFQDTSLQQWNNFVPLLHNAVAQDEYNPVLLVGDIKQSIYRWRGGDWQIFGKKVAEEFSDITIQNLDTNFRSLKRIVDFNNRTIENCVITDNNRLNDMVTAAADDKMISTETKNELVDMLADAYKGQAQKPADNRESGFVRITEYPVNENNDTSPVIRTIEELQQRGFRPSDIAILVRYKFDGVDIAGELLDYKMQHPDSPYSYDIVTQEALTISNSSAVSFIMAVFALSNNPKESIKLAVYNRYLNKKIDSPLSEDEEKFIKNLRLLSIEEAFEEIIIHYSLGDKTDETAYIQALQEQLISFRTSKISDIPLFLKWWDETGCNNSIKLPENSGAITIITIHKAKGLQYKAVIIPFCNWPLDQKNGSVIWTKSKKGDFSQLGQIPVKYKKEMGNSYFADDFYREKVLSHIDNINTFYVAATRAEEELHIMIPFKTGKSQKRTSSGKAPKISDLIMESIYSDSNMVRTDMEDGSTTFEYGTPIMHEHSKKEITPAICYPANRPGMRLKFRLSSQRYFDDDTVGNTVLSPRNYGMLMHKIFENITDISQIDDALETMRSNSTISDKEAKKVGSMIEKSFENPLIKSWFSPEWDTVHNENEIIIPYSSEGGLRRPDRVITKGTDAIVIDYKFGLQHKHIYIRQVSEYMELLRKMGYKNIKGYLWYVELDEVQEVPFK